MSKSPFKGHSFNLIRQRSSPTKITLKSGHEVERQDYVYFQTPSPDASGPGEWIKIRCADYHGEHFVYLDPLYNLVPSKADPNKQITGRGHWFAMCSCGSPAVAVGPIEASLEESDCNEQLLVCYIYHSTLKDFGWGRHADQAGSRRWT